ncbi:SDR family oxidoreductase [Frankia sp. AiPs1]|uniref:NAD(P)-dependent oxidoreductase n=1 Tax=Frankia sp. AiPs1 TaxID=573493 RepID=UPI00204416DC|nr:SDR family oxidoreductase [Frankia sp. AiPs1]MCM3923902.1 SDR family oxidoreductase [Frankia sp. AiPs1]
MKIAVVGATGRTGALVVEQALARGHRVTAVARRPEAVTARHDSLEVVGADVLDRDQLVPVFAGVEAVVSALGAAAGREPTTVYSAGTRNLLAAMRAAGIRTIAVISATPAGPRGELPFVQRRVMMPVLDRFFGAAYADMRRMEEILRASDADWIAVRPPRLLARPATGDYRLVAEAPLPKARSITYPDLATALLDVLDRRDLYRKAVTVAQ